MATAYTAASDQEYGNAIATPAGTIGNRHQFSVEEIGYIDLLLLKNFRATVESLPYLDFHNYQIVDGGIVESPPYLHDDNGEIVIDNDGEPVIDRSVPLSEWGLIYRRGWHAIASIMEPVHES